MATTLREQLEGHLHSEGSVEHFLWDLTPKELLDFADQIRVGLPDVDVVLTSQGRSHSFAFALALSLKARLIIAQDRPFREGQDLMSEVDDRSWFVPKRAVPEGTRVLLVEDLLRYGYTPIGLMGLVAQVDAQVLGYASLLEYSNLGGRNRLEMLSIPVFIMQAIAHTPRGLVFDRRI